MFYDKVVRKFLFSFFFILSIVGFFYLAPNSFNKAYAGCDFKTPERRMVVDSCTYQVCQGPSPGSWGTDQRCLPNTTLVSVNNDFKFSCKTSPGSCPALPSENECQKLPNGLCYWDPKTTCGRLSGLTYSTDPNTPANKYCASIGQGTCCYLATAENDLCKAASGYCTSLGIGGCVYNDSGANNFCKTQLGNQNAGCCTVPDRVVIGKIQSPCLNPSEEFCSKIKTAFDFVPTDAAGFTKWILGFVLSISGGILVLLLILAGYKLMTSQGDPEKIKEARERVTSALVGIFFIIFSFVVYSFITSNILALPGFGG